MASAARESAFLRQLSRCGPQLVCSFMICLLLGCVNCLMIVVLFPTEGSCDPRTTSVQTLNSSPRQDCTLRQDCSRTQDCSLRQDFQVTMGINHMPQSAASKFGPECSFQAILGEARQLQLQMATLNLYCFWCCHLEMHAYFCCSFLVTASGSIKRMLLAHAGTFVCVA